MLFFVWGAADNEETHRSWFDRMLLNNGKDIAYWRQNIVIFFLKSCQPFISSCYTVWLSCWSSRKKKNRKQKFQKLKNEHIWSIYLKQKWTEISISCHFVMRSWGAKWTRKNLFIFSTIRLDYCNEWRIICQKSAFREALFNIFLEIIGNIATFLI